MRAERSKLAQLVINYYQTFGRHVPESAVRLLDVGALAARLQDALATNLPLAEAGCDWASPFEFSPRGCIVRESATPTKGPDGEWLQ